jgi:MFS family permease
MTVYWVVALGLLNHTSYKGSKILLSLFALELGASQFWIGVFYGMYSVLPIVLAVHAGKIADRIGMRMPMLLGSVGLSLGLLIPFLFPGLLALFLSATLIGAFYIFYIVAMQSAIGILPGDRAKNYSIYSLGVAASNFLGPITVGVAIDGIGHASTYLLLALVPLIVAGWLLAKPEPRAKPSRAAGKPERRATFAMLKDSSGLRQILIAGGMIETGIELYTFYMPIYGRSLGLSASQIGIVMATYAAALMAIRFAMPMLVRRSGEAEVMRSSMLLSAVVYCGFPFVSHMVLLLALSFVLGLGFGCCSPLSMLLIHARAPEGRSGEALGLRQVVNKVTESSAPVVFGALGAIFGMAPLFLGSALLLFGGSSLLRRGGRGDS